MVSRRGIPRDQHRSPAIPARSRRRQQHIISPRRGTSLRGFADAAPSRPATEKGRQPPTLFLPARAATMAGVPGSRLLAGSVLDLLADFLHVLAEPLDGVA